MSIFIFSATTGLAVKVLSLFLFCLLGGMIPGTLFATAPLLARGPAYVGVVNGVILQASGVGQLIGPPVLSGLVEWSGRWAIGSNAALVGCTIGCGFAYWLHRDLRRPGATWPLDAKSVDKAV